MLMKSHPKSQHTSKIALHDSYFCVDLVVGMSYSLAMGECSGVAHTLPETDRESTRIGKSCKVSPVWGSIAEESR